MSSNEPHPSPPPLSQSIRLILSLCTLCSTLHPSHPTSPSSSQWYKSTSTAYLQSVLKLLSIPSSSLPSQISPEAIKSSAIDQLPDWTTSEHSQIASTLIQACLAVESAKGKKDEVHYAPITRALSYQTLQTLGLDAKTLIPQAEKELSEGLFKAFKVAEEESRVRVESTRESHSQGWGGSLGRTLATGAGVIAGGVLVGITGGLAAPAIAAVLAPLGIGGLFSAAAAPVVFGTLFGVTGGGLAGKRVRERWRGVEEFGFVEVGAGTKATKEEVEDLEEARKRLRVHKAKEAEEKKKEQEGSMKGDPTVEKLEAGEKVASLVGVSSINEKQLTDIKSPNTGSVEGAPEESSENDPQEPSEEETKAAIAAQHRDLEEQLLNLTLEHGTRRGSIAGPELSRASTDSVRPSVDVGADEKSVADVKKPPSLTATIVVPGLLTVSKTEALTAWRAICSANTPSFGDVAPRAEPRAKTHPDEEVEGGLASSEIQDGPNTSPVVPFKNPLKDGRDVYLLRFETGRMLQTGRDIDMFVFGKIKGKLKAEIIKRTVLSAYFAAVSLPRYVYGMATMTLDNTWMQAQDRARKAGRLLGEVLEKRVQGERPVVLIGSSIGALTVFEALLYLASLSPPTGARGPVSNYVESAILIALPSAPTQEEWAKVRSVTARRIVNAWSGSDYVLAGVVRLHEVVGRAVSLSSGVQIAGLGPVERPGVEDIDVSSVVGGHMELQAKMGDVMRLIDVDA